MQRIHSLKNGCLYSIQETNCVDSLAVLCWGRFVDAEHYEYLQNSTYNFWCTLLHKKGPCQRMAAPATSSLPCPSYRLVIVPCMRFPERSSNSHIRTVTSRKSLDSVLAATRRRTRPRLVVTNLNVPHTWYKRVATLVMTSINLQKDHVNRISSGGQRNVQICKEKLTRFKVMSSSCRL